MPVYVMGSDSSQNPLALGSVESGLLFHWSLGNPGVLDIQPRHTQVPHISSHKSLKGTCNVFVFKIYLFDLPVLWICLLQAGVTVSPAHSFSVLVKAQVVGRTSLKVIVELANHTVESPQQLSDEIQLVVNTHI